MAADLDAVPGFRRRIRIEPSERSVRAAVEDDFHHMHVTLHHDGATVASVDGVMERAPWTTCPGAPAQLRETFTGVALADVAGRGQKQANCTHLHDLAVLAAAHAGDAEPMTYDIFVSDPVEGSNASEIRRNGKTVLAFTMEQGVVVEPIEAAGISVLKLRPWIDSLPTDQCEAARILQWATIIAHGRVIPIEQQSDATKIPPNCYTFQPHRAVEAIRNGKIIDFSKSERKPLEPAAQ